MENLIMVLVSVAGLGLVVTKIVDGVRNAADPSDSPRLKVVWNILAFVIGIGMAYVWSDMGGFVILGAGPTTFGTGLLIGAVASGWHEGLDRLSP
ncbi:MAG: hypothetical protein WC911_03490 [Thermoleophilia bacterium]